MNGLRAPLEKQLSDIPNLKIDTWEDTELVCL